MVAASGIGGARPPCAGVTISLPARWRLLGDDERSSLGDLTTDESIHLIAVSDRQVGERSEDRKSVV